MTDAQTSQATYQVHRVSNHANISNKTPTQTAPSQQTSQTLLRPMQFQEHGLPQQHTIDTMTTATKFAMVPSQIQESAQYSISQPDPTAMTQHTASQA